jgi:hypothetical protein
VAFWEVRNGRRAKVIHLPDEVAAVSWCPNASISVAAIAFGSTVWLVNPVRAYDTLLSACTSFCSSVSVHL